MLPGEAGVGAGGGLPHQRGHCVRVRPERGGARAGASGRLRVPAGAFALSDFLLRVGFDLVWMGFGLVLGWCSAVVCFGFGFV